jgi:hypothetical protein
VKLRLEAIRRALEEHDYSLEVSIHVTNAGVSPAVTRQVEASITADHLHPGTSGRAGMLESIRQGRLGIRS